MSQAGEIDVVGNNPDIPTNFVTDDGNAVPIANTLEILGTSVPAGSIPVETTGSGNTVTIEVQTSQAIAASNAANIGLAAFNSAEFNVDANGFVSLAGGSLAIDSIGTQTGTNPIVPTAGGLVTINGAVVAAGTNPVRSDGTGANIMAIEVQISQALAATDATKIGLANFDSAAFDVDANGFVQLNGGGIAATSFDVQANTAPGTDPVVPTAAGLVTVNGAAVANHSVVLETRSRAANAYNLEVQYATSAAATDATKSGVAHYNSAQFTVDANGFVSFSGTGAVTTLTGNTGGAISPTAGNFNIVTANSTVKFAGSGSTLTQDFGLSNLVLGTSATAITSATFNTGLGSLVFTSLSSGSSNTCIGFGSGALLDTASSNTLIGAACGDAITSSPQNVAVGSGALGVLSTGTGNNVAVGRLSLQSLATGNTNTCIGDTSGSSYTTSESGNILIGKVGGTVGESNTTRIGLQGTAASCFIAGITGNTVSNAQTVTINSSTGQLGVLSSAVSSKITSFISNSSWTIDPRAISVEFFVWGGGGGGGSGRCGVSNAAGGGGGGGGSGFVYLKTQASFLTASPYTITIGTGGTGGIAINAVTTNGNPGGTGNPTSVGTAIIAPGGLGGAGGTSAGAAGGTGSGYLMYSATVPAISSGGGGNATLGNPGTSTVYGWATGGGAGCGYTTTTARTGNAGGSITDGGGNILVAGGLAGDNAGNVGGNGNAPGTQSTFVGATGGGGGGHDAALVAGTGGNGAQPGGGGGGGAGNLSSNPSGAGGNGGDGKVIIIEYF